MNGESYNYANENDTIHDDLDVRPPNSLDYNLRDDIKDNWVSPKNKSQYNGV